MGETILRPLELTQVRQIDKNDLEFVGKSKKVELVMPNVSKINQHDLIHLSNANELISTVPRLQNIDPDSFKTIMGLTIVVMRAPKLKYFDAKLFHHIFLSNKISHLELCPIGSFPQDLLVNQHAIKVMRICNYDQSLHFGIPSSNNYTEITLKNGKFSIYICG